MKIRQFGSYDNYEASGNYEEIDVVKHGKFISADLLTECKNYKTAIKRFFKGLKGVKGFEGWDDFIYESCENGIFTLVSKYPDESIQMHYNIEPQDESLFYIELTVEM